MESLPDPSCLGTPVPAIDKSIFRKYKTYLRLNQVTIVHHLVLYMKLFELLVLFIKNKIVKRNICQRLLEKILFGQFSLETVGPLL